MSNLHRLRWIDVQIRTNRYPNCTKIAEEFEISVRQASRDIEYLKYSLNAPLAYSKQENGYYYQDAGFMIPSLFITVEEKESLLNLAEQYKSLGTKQSIKLSVLFEKISRNEGDIQKNLRGNTPFDIPLSQVKNYQLITEAIDQKVKVIIHYVNAGLSTSQRLIHPFNWICRFNHHYIVGFCENKNEIRLFRLDRIIQASLMSELFVIPEGYDVERYKKEVAFNRREPFQATFLVESTQEVREHTFYDCQQFLGSLVADYGNFQIIKPVWLREMFAKKLRLLLEKHTLTTH
jgi:predicted DNA-binding transcriptional regulator YafY